MHELTEIKKREPTTSLGTQQEILDEIFLYSKNCSEVKIIWIFHTRRIFFVFIVYVCYVFGAIVTLSPNQMHENMRITNVKKVLIGLKEMGKRQHTVSGKKTLESMMILTKI